jgi:glycerol-3-phosphate dehydrogenase
VPSPKVNSWAVAFNLVLSRAINPTYGVAGSTQKRMLFAVPRPEVPSGPGAVGTWYVPATDADPYSEAKPAVSEAEIAAAIADVNEGIPEANLNRSEVVGIESGVLPCVSAPGERPVRLLGRERIETFGRIIKVVSTKYTTFETQARWAVNTVEEIFKSNRPKPPTL